jgi:hypothetical protein
MLTHLAKAHKLLESKHPGYVPQGLSCGRKLSAAVLYTQLLFCIQSNWAVSYQKRLGCVEPDLGCCGHFTANGEPTT